MPAPDKGFWRTAGNVVQKRWRNAVLMCGKQTKCYRFDRQPRGFCAIIPEFTSYQPVLGSMGEGVKPAVKGRERLPPSPFSFLLSDHRHRPTPSKGLHSGFEPDLSPLEGHPVPVSRLCRRRIGAFEEREQIRIGVGRGPYFLVRQDILPHLL